MRRDSRRPDERKYQALNFGRGNCEMLLRRCRSLRLREQFWAGEINLGTSSTETVIKAGNPDKISKRINTDGGHNSVKY